MYRIACIISLFTIHLLFHWGTAYANPTIVVLGNSLSAAYQMTKAQSWPSLLESRLKETYPTGQVINSSVRGNTTANGLLRIQNVLETHKPDIVILLLGGNDGLRGLPISKVQKNLSTIIEHCQAKKSTVLLIEAPILPNYGKAYTQKFAKMFQTLSDQYNIPLIQDFLKDIGDNPELMFSDRLHPKPQAQPQLMEKVWEPLKKLLSHKSQPCSDKAKTLGNH